LDEGTFTTIDVPGALFTSASGINNDGQVVGFYITDDEEGESHGFLLDEGTFTTIDVPDGESTIAWGINDRLQIVGFYADTFLLRHSFVAQ